MAGVGIGLYSLAASQISREAAIRVRSGGAVPVATQLIAGQTGNDLPAPWFDPANYLAPGNVTVALQANFADITLSAPFNADETVLLRVADDQGSAPMLVTIDSSVSYPAPVVTGALTDQSFMLGASASTYDASVGFTGNGLSFALTSAPAGVVIDGATGVINVSGAGSVSAALVTVQAQASDGQTVEDSFLLDIIAGSISATVPPAMSPLYDGQAVQDIAGYAAMTDVSNFTSNVGTISTVDVTVQGAADPATTLSEGSNVGFTVVATDSTGLSSSFTADPINVEYKARIISTSGNEAEVEINPIVPDSEVLALVFSGTPYDSTYTPTAGDIRGPEPYNFSGTVTLASSGDIAAPVTDDVLTVNDGLWNITAGNLSIAREWLRDGTVIPGETTSAYTLVAGDESANISCRLIADDGTNPVTQVTSDVVFVPATSTGESPTRVSGPISSSGTTTSHDLSALADGDTIYIAAMARFNSSGKLITGLTYNGNPATLVVSSSAAGTVVTAIYKVIKGAETSANVDVLHSGGLQESQVAIYRANGWVNEAVGQASAAAQSLTVNVDISNPGAVIAVGADKGGGGAGSLSFTAGPVIEDAQATVASNADVIFGIGDTAATVSGQAFTLSPSSGTPSLALCVVALS